MNLTMTINQGQITVIMPKRTTHKQMVAVREALNPKRIYTTVDDRTAFVLTAGPQLPMEFFK